MNILIIGVLLIQRSTCRVLLQLLPWQDNWSHWFSSQAATFNATLQCPLFVRLYPLYSIYLEFTSLNQVHVSYALNLHLFAVSGLIINPGHISAWPERTLLVCHGIGHWRQLSSSLAIPWLQDWLILSMVFWFVHHSLWVNNKYPVSFRSWILRWTHYLSSFGFASQVSSSFDFIAQALVEHFECTLFITLFWVLHTGELNFLWILWKVFGDKFRWGHFSQWPSEWALVLYLHPCCMSQHNMSNAVITTLVHGSVAGD